MPGPTPDFVLKAGDTKILELALKEADGVTPQDLTGVQAIVAEFALYRDTATTALLTKSLNSGVVVADSDPTTGVIWITLAPADTLALAKGNVRLEVRVTDADGDVSSIFFPREPRSAAGWHFSVFTVEPQYIT
jgi:uncharacterized Rossmann fold enzyme